MKNQSCICKYLVLGVLLGISLTLSADFVLQGTDKLTGILPEPQQIYLSLIQDKPFEIDKNISITIAMDSSALEKKAVCLLQEDFAKAYGLNISSAVCSFNSSNKYLLISKSNSKKVFKTLIDIANKFSAPAKNAEQSYKMVVTADGILISSFTEEGVFYGVQTLRQLLRKECKVAAIGISDWPDQKIRASYGTMPRMTMEEYIRTLASLKINMAIMESPWAASSNWWYSPSGENADKADEFFRLCKEYNVEPVPFIQGFGWAYGVVGLNVNCVEGIWVENEPYILHGNTEVEIKNRNVLKSQAAKIDVASVDKKITYIEGRDYKIIHGLTRPRFSKTNKPWKIVRTENSRIASDQKVLLSYNYMDYCALQTPYCPNDPDTYKIVDKTLTKIIKKYKPKYIHIGHDEVRYINRCSRCKKSGLSSEDIVVRDINHWYKTINKTDPTIKVMIWVDLLREGHFDRPIIQEVDENIIISPWIYGDKAGTLAVMSGQINWIMKKNNRSVFAAGSGYSNLNIWLWNQACRKYSDNKKMLGFFFTFWGESLDIWSSLSFSAEYSWSSAKPDKKVFDLYNDADIICRKRGLGLGLNPQIQREIINKRLNFGLLSGADIRGQADEFKSLLLSVRKKLEKYFLGDYGRTVYASNIDSPRLIGRLDAIVGYYGKVVDEFLVSNKGKAKGIKAPPRYLCKKKTNLDSLEWEKDTFWKDIPMSGEFIIRNGNVLKLSEWATAFQMAYDEKNIYARIVCPFPDKTKLEYNTNATRKSATPIWENDCIQVFLRPSKVSNSQKDPFYQVIVNIVGKTMTIVHNGKKKAVALPVKCEITNNDWSCKMAIPLSWLDASAKALPQEKWGMNVARTQLYPKEYASWSLLPTGTMLWFLQPDFFGELTFK